MRVEKKTRRYFARTVLVLATIFAFGCSVCFAVLCLKKDRWAIITVDSVRYDIDDGKYFVAFSIISKNCWVSLPYPTKPHTSLVSGGFRTKQRSGGESNYFGPNRTHASGFYDVKSDIYPWLLVKIGHSYFVSVNESLPLWKAETDESEIVIVSIHVSKLPE